MKLNFMLILKHKRELKFLQLLVYSSINIFFLLLCLVIKKLEEKEREEN